MDDAKPASEEAGFALPDDDFCGILWWQGMGEIE